MTIDQYIDNLNRHYKLGYATEHTFRGDLQQLLESLVPSIRATNEPKRQSCGAPDYILTNQEIPVGFIEAKDIGDKDLEGAKKTGNKEQFDRYKASLGNIIFTDYLDFHLYVDGVFVAKVAIAELKNGAIVPLPGNFAAFTNLIKDFCTHIGQTIKSSKKLAEMMAGKARLLSDVIEKALTSDEINNENSTLKDQMTAFKQILIHDITPKGFADVYAQTIAYGMFAARLHDPTLPTFSRHEAAELIPRSNPFLRKLFGYIAGPDIDDRIKWIVDSLVDIFLACNVEEILKNYNPHRASPEGGGQREDPVIHFYETFLSEYDPKLRKARGVWYTPQPVVGFQVRAIDEILKTEFGITAGIADNSKIKIKVNVQGKQVEQEVHRVQMLDPATGTGTYIAAVIKHIHKRFVGQEGIWSNYVENHLLPRLIGFELLMASYAMAHLQIDLLLTETGYKPTKEQRLKIYLTNSLEEHHPDTGTLFANWLSSEANEANYIKRDAPIMIVMGNPPYSVSSSNKGEWILNLIKDYKKDLNERKINLDDDYIKFIRYGQHFIDKNGSGILTYISNNSFLDGITHRQMRKSLLESFDKVYILDLHGSVKKNETALDGSKDENVFDIQQGVSINIYVKTNQKKKGKLAEVNHFELYGLRDEKYLSLIESSINSINWTKLNYKAPNFFFVPKNFSEESSYIKGFKIDHFFVKYSSGIESQKDSVAVQISIDEIKQVFDDFSKLSESVLATKYKLKDGRDWKISTSKEDVIKNGREKISRILYRPFDIRYSYLSGVSKGLVAYPRYEISKNLLKPNIGLLTCSRQTSFDFQHCFITDKPTERCTVSLQTGEVGYVFPLYLYPETKGQQTLGQDSPPLEGLGEVRTPNLNAEIVKQIADKLGLTFTNEKTGLTFGETSPTPPKEGLFTDGLLTDGNITEGVLKPGYITANAKNYVLIKEMRDGLKNNPTEAEKIMWEYLRNKKTGYKIRRQHIIDDFITDFVCLSMKLVIEIDGKIHLKQKEYDELRTAKLNELGFEVIRFTNEEVYANPELVALKVKEKLDHKSTQQNNNDTNTDDSLSSDADSERDSPPSENDSLPSVEDSPPSEGLGEVEEVFAPIDLLDYIYAVLHSPTYREKYKEFLKIDFPRVPYPKDKATFWQLVKLGGQIRQIHLLESPIVEQYITQYPIDGNNTVSKPIFSPSTSGRVGVGSVYINDTQYFNNVPQIAWEFYIGGYQPAQKWLKDRKGRKLEFEDILHYQKIIVALTETDRLMKEIDLIDIE